MKNNKDQPVERREMGERRSGIKGRRQEQEERWKSRTSALAAGCSWTQSHEDQKNLGVFSAEHYSLYFRKDPHKGAKMRVGKHTSKDTIPKQSSNQLHVP